MEETQGRILDTAAELFAQQGHAGVSMRDIARAVGITQAAIYHHFTSKDALYFAAISYSLQLHTLGISEQMAELEAPTERLELLVKTMMETMDGDPRFRQLYLRELLEGDEHRLAALAESAFTEFHETVSALMAELAPGKDPQLYIFSLAGLIFHHLEARKLAPYLPNPPEVQADLSSLTNHITQLFLQGVCQ